MDIPDIRWFSDNAGRRTTPYPHDLAPVAEPVCANPGCGAALAGERGKDGWRLRYCDQACQRRHASLVQFAAHEAARHERRLGLGVSTRGTER